MVKRLGLCLCAVVLLGLPSLARSESRAGYPGSWYVAGQFGMNIFLGGGEADSPNQGFEVSFVPRALYFPIKGLGAGLEGNLYYYSNSYQSIGLAIGPRAAYYITWPNGRYARGCCLIPFFDHGAWLPFVGASVLFVSQRDVYGGAAYSSSGYRARVGLGISPLIGEKATMPIELGFETSALSSGGEVASMRSTNKIYVEGGFGAFLFRK